MILDPVIIKLCPCTLLYPFWGIAHQSKTVIAHLLNFNGRRGEEFSAELSEDTR